MMGTDHIDEIVETWRSDVQDGDEIVEVVRESTVNDGYDTVKVKRTWTSWVWLR